MTYDQWKTTDPNESFEPIEPDEPEFCLIHGYVFMKYQWNNPIPHCTECERENDQDFPFGVGA